LARVTVSETLKGKNFSVTDLKILSVQRLTNSSDDITFGVAVAIELVDVRSAEIFFDADGEGQGDDASDGYEPVHPGGADR